MDGDTWFLTISTAIGGFLGWCVGVWRQDKVCHAVPDNCVYEIGELGITEAWGRWQSEMIVNHMQLGLFSGFIIGVLLVTVLKYTTIQVSLKKQ